MRIFLAGESGAIGRQLLPLLIRAGHDVTGTSRSPDRAAEIERAGGKRVVVDVFDVAPDGDAQPFRTPFEIADVEGDQFGASEGPGKPDQQQSPVPQAS